MTTALGPQAFCGLGKGSGGGGSGVSLGPVPILLEDFESTTGFTGGTNQTATAPTDNPIHGSAYLNSKANAVATGQGITAFKTKVTQFDPAASFGDHIAIAFKQDPFATLNVSCELARSGTAFSNFNDATVNADNKPRGWQWKSQALSGLISGLGSVQIRPRYGTRNPSNADVSYDALLVGLKPKARVTFGFDDGWVSPYNTVEPYMTARGVVGQINVVRNTMEGGSGFRLNPTQASALYAKGWAMCLNTGNDFSITAWADPAEVVAEFQAAQAYNLAHGWTRGSDCLVYSEGIYQTEPVVCHATAIVADGVSTSITINTISGAQIPVNGMKMSAFGSEGLLTIQNVIGAAVPFTVLLDGVAAATVTRAAFYDDSGAFTPKGKIQTPAPGPLALQNAGFKLGRTTMGGGMYIEAGFGDQALQANGQGASLATYAQLQGYVDAAIANGSWVHFYFHNVDGGTAIDIDMSILAPLIDYCVTKRTAGLLDIITAPDAVAIAEAGKARLATLVAVT